MDREAYKASKTGKECEDFHVELPCHLADRVRLYATENNTAVANVVIEALDTFLREQRMNQR